MTRLLRGELGRALGGWPFYRAVAAGAAVIAWGMLQMESRGIFPDSNPHDAWHYGMDAFLLLAPLIAGSPYGDSFAQDWTTGYTRYVLLRTSRRRYLGSKALANALAGGLAISLSMLLGLGLAHLIYPDNPPRGIYATYAGPRPREMFYDLFLAHPLQYQLCLCGLGILFGAVYATLTLAVSTRWRNRYTALATPFLLYYLVDFVLANLRLERWLLPIALQPTTMSGTTPANVFIPLLALLIPSTLVVLAATRSKDVLG